MLGLCVDAACRWGVGGSRQLSSTPSSPSRLFSIWATSSLESSVSGPMAMRRSRVRGGLVGDDLRVQANPVPGTDGVALGFGFGAFCHAQ